MSKRIAVVTGGTGGLGIAMCEALCDQGHTVIATYYPSPETEAQAKECQESMKAWGAEVLLYPLDVSSFESCQNFITTVEAEHGPVDILVNNAGITRDAPLKRMEHQQWQDVIDTNLSSMFNMSKLVFNSMCERGWGRIINISSLNGEKGQFGQANYAAAKAGIYGFTRSIALEGARKGVTVNAVSPGYIDTPMVRQVPEKVLNSIVEGIPVGRLGKPVEIARAVAFLAAEDSGFITGTNLSVNGGQYMS
ncbi:3-oxoacyl-[acyl-carrier-protein] reductase [Oceanospirillum multiglobuliferum]|uniref:Beta-ketoacyl-ACP reductase n=1 Tax=Oceanospirillum multiglobuliferum TaxID=64969 RepID=A0A1T4KFE9_9GAMM|nr:acetoacetyl-CoA reductase [Oceanospirillum multiglobuliferum]OPX56011.1 beta-ketoacyl-ACP reductase [Oceanospirillum multiglobuliferum]SJZ41063.1 3-oxoacyl-[acyl-carrier-protein] reductase [Oceanospirillum multiglobuliferum]